MKKNKWLLISIIITIFVISFIYAINGIYPFGKNIFSLLDFDNGYTPVYYKLWDILHGKGSILFDWNLGMGLNCYGSLIMNSLLLPTSWIIGIFKRNFIPYAMSFIMLFKMLTIQIICYLTLKKFFPKMKNYYYCAFSLIYTFSGWSLLMLSNILYLDAVALFPLFVYSLLKLLKEGKWKLYLIILTLILLFSYYIAYQILFFIFGFTIIYLIFSDVKDKKKKAIIVLLLTLLSLGLSCILVLPSIYQSLTSYRIAGKIVPLETGFGILSNKAIYMFPHALLFALNIKLISSEKDKKRKISLMLLLLYLLIPIFVEPINALWHTGSHSGFPFRFAFIPIFIMILYSMNYLNNIKFEDKKINVSNIISISLMFIISIILYIQLRKNISNVNFAISVETYGQFWTLFLIFIFQIVAYLFSVKTNKKTFIIILFCTIIVNILLFSDAYIKFEGNTSLKTNRINREFNINSNDYGIVDNNGDLGINFPYIFEQPSITNRLHIIKEEELHFITSFDYYTFDTVIYSMGGTEFSNLLLMNKYFLSKSKLNPSFYNIEKCVKDNCLYSLKYNLNYLVPYNGTKFVEDTDDYIDYNNQISKKLFDYGKEILHKEIVNETDDYYEVNFLPNKNYFIRMAVKDDNFQKLNNMHFNYNYIVDNERSVSAWVEREQTILIPKSAGTIKDIVSLDADELKEFTSQVNKFETIIKTNKNVRTYSFDTEEETDVLIPVNYDDAMQIFVNGKRVEYSKNVINMYSVHVNKGHNEITLKYVPKMLKEGILTTTISTLILLFFTLTNKKAKYFEHKCILYPLFIITAIIGAGFILKVYILSWL